MVMAAQPPRSLSGTPVSLRVLGVTAVAVTLGLVHLPGRPRTLCVLRAVTGVPCPFCGGTTAVADLGRMRFLAALAASPLAVAMIGALPFARSLSLRVLVPRAAFRWAVVAIVLLAAEVWQLQRYGVAPF